MNDARWSGLAGKVRAWSIGGLLALAVFGGISRGDDAAAAKDAGGALAAELAGLKDVKTLDAGFICEKKLALLDSPLLSRGKLWIRRGDPRTGDGAVRFLTEKPYVSDLILVKGKVFVRSQHETEWTRTDQSGRPGLTTVMAELGGWSTGEAGKIAEQYTVTAGAAADVPEAPGGVAAATQPAKSELEVFELTPVNKDLLKAVKRITVAIDGQSHHLVFLEILTAQDDATRYWFYGVKDNPSLETDVFSPKNEPATQGAGGASAGTPAGEKP